MTYTEVKIWLPEEYFDIIIAELNEYYFEGFVEEDEYVLAYLPEEKFDQQVLQFLKEKYAFISKIETECIAQRNWNAEWESQYEPVIFLDKYIFRAPFHSEEPDYVNFIISPKMAFGTGHHETTEMMIELMEEVEINNLNILDYGSGTGILSVFASYKKAKKILALDIEVEAYDSCLENCQLNDISNITPMKGDISSIKNGNFDIILANLNRNIITHSSETLEKIVKPGGLIFVSGFFEEDIETITEALKSYRLHKYITKNNWAACIYIKN
jgi:ribosomal protein L11 methyltransferase